MPLLTAQEGKDDCKGGKDSHRDGHTRSFGVKIDADQEVAESGVSEDARIGEESLQSHGSIFGGGVFVVAKASLEVGAADFGFVIADRHGIGLEVADEIHLLAGAGDAGIDEVALEHHEVLFE